MYNLVREYQSRGLSVKAFSKERGNSPSTFGYWIRKKKEKDHPSGFVEVDNGLKSSASEMELIYPNGVKLQMSSPVLTLIARLVKLY